MKVADGSHVRSGGIIVRQRGTSYRPGTNVRQGSDDTLFAVAPGVVRFRKRTFVGFNGRPNLRTVVSVVAATA